MTTLRRHAGNDTSVISHLINLSRAHLALIGTDAVVGVGVCSTLISVVDVVISIICSTLTDSNDARTIIFRAHLLRTGLGSDELCSGRATVEFKALGWSNLIRLLQAARCCGA